MATAKKKSSAKKRPIKKTASSKAVAKKANTKVKSVAVEKKAKAVKTPTKLSRLELVKRFHIFSAFVSILIAIGAVTLLGSQAANFTINYSAKDPIASVNQTVLGPATESIATVEYRYLIAGAFTLFAILSILLATLLRKKYEAGVNNSTSGIRWIITGINMGVIFSLVSVFAGVQDILTTKMVGLLILVTAVLLWLAERDNKQVSSPRWATYVTSLFTGVFAWLPLVVALLGTYVFGMERFSWYVYVLALLLLFASVRFSTNLYRYIKYPKTRGDYVNWEEKYLSNELFMKLSFAAVIFVALID